jgi:cbb3-type cytochrome oxidase maturation protein
MGFFVFMALELVHSRLVLSRRRVKRRMVVREVVMGVLYLFVPISMVIAGILVWAAFWAIRNNQYEDLEGPAHRILLDDDDPRIPTQPKSAESVKPSADKTTDTNQIPK